MLILLTCLLSYRGILHVEAEVRGDLADHLWSDTRRLPRISVDECVFAKRVDQSRKASRLLMQLNYGVPRKQFKRIGVSRQFQTSTDVTLGLVQIQGAKART